MNLLVARAELERNASRLRQIADDLRAYAPMIAMKLDALAQECELRRADLDVKHERHFAVPARCPIACRCAECSP